MHPNSPQTTIDVHVAKKIQDLRKTRGMKARALDQATGETPGTIARLERGARRIYTNHLLRIAQVLKVPPTYFFEGLPETADEGLQTQVREGMRLAKAFHNIQDPATRRELLDMMKALAEDPNFSNS